MLQLLLPAMVKKTITITQQILQQSRPLLLQLIGGAISGATAGLITTALGMAYIKIMEMVYKGELTKEQLMGEEGKDKMKRIFKDELKKKK